MKSKPDYSIRAIYRTAEVLNCFTRKYPEQSLIDITKETGLHKSTVFRILDTLEQLKWVRRDSKLGTYQLGFDLFELGFRAVQGLDFYNVSLTHLEKLTKVTRQSAHLVVRDNGKALYINKVESASTIISQPSQIGLRLPMHCTAVGKILLSGLPADEVDAILDREGMNKVTANTLDQPVKLHKALVEIQEQGYALDNEEIQIGLRCVAAPVRDFKGRVVAAVSVSGLAASFYGEQLSFYIEAVKNAALKISEDLGWKQ